MIQSCEKLHLPSSETQQAQDRILGTKLLAIFMENPIDERNRIDVFPMHVATAKRMLKLRTFPRPEGARLPQQLLSTSFLIRLQRGGEAQDLKAIFLVYIMCLGNFCVMVMCVDEIIATDFF